MKGEEHVAKDSGGKQLVVIFAGDVCNLPTFNLCFMSFFYFGKVLVNAFGQFSLPKPTLSQRCVHFCAQMTRVVLQLP